MYEAVVVPVAPVDAVSVELVRVMSFSCGMRPSLVRNSATSRCFSVWPVNTTSVVAAAAAPGSATAPPGQHGRRDRGRERLQADVLGDDQAQLLQQDGERHARLVDALGRLRHGRALRLQHGVRAELGDLGLHDGGLVLDRRELVLLGVHVAAVLDVHQPERDDDEDEDEDRPDEATLPRRLYAFFLRQQVDAFHGLLLVIEGQAEGDRQTRGDQLELLLRELRLVLGDELQRVAQRDRKVQGAREVVAHVARE